MKVLFNKIKCNNKINNKGMALISVMVIVGFIAALVSILLMTTLVNFKMKAVNSKGKDAFYSAEQAIDEINIGLQQIVADSMSEAYFEIMSNYSSLSEDEKDTKMATIYYENIWKKLEVKESDGVTSKYGNSKYDVEKLVKMLKDKTRYHETDSGNEYGAIVVAVEEGTGVDTMEGDMVTYLNYGVVLKNLKVYYKDPKGFVSVITTDIRLSYPNFKFATGTDIADIPNFSIIGDKSVAIGAETDGSKTDLELKGDLFANNIQFNNKNISLADTLENRYIVKYNLAFKNSTFENTEDNIIWAKNIVVDSSNATIKGVTRVNNDLDIKGRNSEVRLEGEYIGFGSGKLLEESDKSITRDLLNDDSSQYVSSAVLVNGVNSKLDISGLKRFDLYGRAYISTTTADLPTEVSSLNEALDEKKDVATGQSMATKPNQLLYLVPASAIYVDELTGRSALNKNPITQQEYEDMLADIERTKNAGTKESRYVEVSLDVEIPELCREGEISSEDENKKLSRTLKAYMKQSGSGVAQPIRVCTGRGGLVYYYMQFKDADSANKYFETYYQNNASSIDEYNKLYLADTTNKNDKATSRTAGTIYNKKKNTNNTSADAQYVAPTTKYDYLSGVVDPENQFAYDSSSYTNDFMSLYTDLTVNNSVAANKAKNTFEDSDDADQVVFEHVVMINKQHGGVVSGEYSDFIDLCNDLKNDSTKYQSMLDEGKITLEYNVKDGGKTIEFLKDDPTDLSGTKKVVVAVVSKETDPNKPVVVNSDPENAIQLVIALGDVKVERDFEGLIIADGKIEVSSSVASLKCNSDEVSALMKDCSVWDESLDKAKAIVNTLYCGQHIRLSGEEDSISNLSLASLVTYENWKKE